MNFSDLKKKISELLYSCPVSTSSTTETRKEKYYNNKYPKKDIVYQGQPIPNSNTRVSIDLRDFFNEYDSEVKKVVKELNISRSSDDEKALQCLLWVIKNIKYTEDYTKGHTEFWQFPFETLHYKTGDCEDGAILLANMLLISGIPYWKIRLSAGKVSGGAYAYLTYYCEDSAKWVILDWCYKINKNAIKNRTDYKDESNYSTVWMSWNQKYSFTKGLNSEAKKLLS